MSTSPENPLTEADPTSLEEYFSRDPNDLLDKDIALITRALRAQRKTWLAAEAGGATRGTRAKAALKAPLSAASPTLSLDDLKLDI